jgi:branched-chain amino acid transport system ATP-binding protein
MTAALEVTGLDAGYGRIPVLHDVTLTLQPASITAVLGANGAGKTTLLRAISGLLRASSGEIRLHGKDLADVAVSDRVGLGMTHVPEGRGVVGELTVDENLRLGGLWRPRADSQVSKQAIAEVYELFEPLARRRTHHGHQLSGGERQMLALGRALVARPSVLLLDEPSLGLAPAVVASMLALLSRLRNERELAILLVEQNVHSALSIADDGVVIALGRVVVSGPAAQLQGDADLRHAYLGF